MDNIEANKKTSWMLLLFLDEWLKCSDKSVKSIEAIGNGKSVVAICNGKPMFTLFYKDGRLEKKVWWNDDTVYYKYDNDLLMEETLGCNVLKSYVYEDGLLVGIRKGPNYDKFIHVSSSLIKMKLAGNDGHKLKVKSGQIVKQTVADGGIYTYEHTNELLTLEKYHHKDEATDLYTRYEHKGGLLVRVESNFGALSTYDYTR
jgi:hypothetical protein